MVSYFKYSVGFILAVLISGILLNCSSVKTSSKKVNNVSATEMVKILSSDEFEGRKPGTIGLEKATQYVEEYLRGIQIKPYYNNSYRDTLLVKGVESYNLVGVIENNKSIDEYVLIGAHLDHIGKSRSLTDSINNGANDDATGVAAVLHIARELKKHNFKRKVIIAIFTGEEEGVIGSKHLAKKLKSENVDLKYVLNFEMFGKPLTRSPGKIYATGYHRSNIAEVLNGLLNEEFVVNDKIDAEYNLFKYADNYPFYLEFNVPSHTFCAFDFENFKYYHQPKDEFSEIDIENLELLIQKSTMMVVKLLESNSDISMKKDAKGVNLRD